MSDKDGPRDAARASYVPPDETPTGPIPVISDKLRRPAPSFATAWWTQASGDAPTPDPDAPDDLPAATPREPVTLQEPAASQEPAERATQVPEPTAWVPFQLPPRSPVDRAAGPPPLPELEPASATFAAEPPEDLAVERPEEPFAEVTGEGAEEPEAGVEPFPERSEEPPPAPGASTEAFAAATPRKRRRRLRPVVLASTAAAVVLVAGASAAVLGGSLTGSDPPGGAAPTLAPTTAVAAVPTPASPALPRFTGRHSVVDGRLSAAGVTYARLGGKWARAADVRKLTAALGADPKPVMRSGTAEYLATPLPQAYGVAATADVGFDLLRHTVATAKYPAGATVTPYAAEALTGGTRGWLTAVRVTSGADWEVAVAVVIDTGHGHPAVLFATIPKDHKALLSDIRPLVASVKASRT